MLQIPYPFHHANSLMCLKAKKAVLCEKPFTINAVECAELIACARQEKVFLMEAMWTRFLPTIVKVRDWLSQSAIGEVRLLQADFGFRAEVEPDGRLFNKK
jgi:predicted dehydrogenase